MDGFIARLKTEREELGTKLKALEEFLTRGAPGTTVIHKAMLDTQAALMRAYHHVLTLRLTDLNSLAHRSEPAVASEPALGEAQETGGHDEDRDGPIPFGG